jgi:NSS family neurotransmitter:Na+ symporter
MTFFGVMDYVSSNVLLLIGAFITSLFVGWRVSRTIVAEELAETSPFGRRLAVWSLRYLCPLAIAAVFATALA